MIHINLGLQRLCITFLKTIIRGNKMKIEDIIQKSLELKKDLEYHIAQHKYYQNRCFELEERLEYVKERHNEICQEDFIIE